MVEDSRIMRHSASRVLIETQDVLAPLFPDSLVCLTGAQLCLLRNLTQYLHRRDSFVSEYRVEYYLCPTVEEWDALEAVTADLEDKLMGCPELEQHLADIAAGVDYLCQKDIWSYTDRWAENLSLTADGSGYVLKQSAPVPDGQVYVLQSVGMVLLQRATTFPSLAVSNGVFSSVLNAAASLAANTWMFWVGGVALKAGDYVELYLSGSQEGDTFTASAWGYKMALSDV